MKNIIFSGSADGEICSWLLTREKCLFNLKAHRKCIRGLSINYNGKFLLSCSDDSSLKLWKILENKEKPEKNYDSDFGFTSTMFNPVTSYFLTTGTSIIIWDLERFIPVQKIFQKELTISCAKFNPIEFNILLSSSSNRSLMLHDLRLHSPVTNFAMEMRTNDIVWSKANPWEFVIANEDSNLYTFDIRKINHVKKVFKGHVMPVQSIDLDKESDLLVSGSLDRTIRIYSLKFNFESEVYSSSRMSRVLCVGFSSDYNIIFSGSEDGNLRLWKRPDEMENFYGYNDANKKKSNKKNYKSNIFSKCSNRFFLPKLVKSMRRIKTRLDLSKQSKKTRVFENILPGSASTKNNFKIPTYIM